MLSGSVCGDVCATVELRRGGVDDEVCGQHSGCDVMLAEVQSLRVGEVQQICSDSSGGGDDECVKVRVDVDAFVEKSAELQRCLAEVLLGFRSQPYQQTSHPLRSARDPENVLDDLRSLSVHSPFHSSRSRETRPSGAFTARTSVSEDTAGKLRRNADHGMRTMAKEHERNTVLS